MKDPDKSFFSLLDNDSFVQWIINPTPELESYWQERIRQDEELTVNITTLRDIIKKLRIKEPVLSQSDKIEIWSNIERETFHNIARRRSLRKVWLSVASVAAAIAVLIGGYWIFMDRGQPQETDYMSVLSKMEDGSAGIDSNNVVLTLADNKRIIVDSPDIIYAKDGSSNIYPAGHIKNNGDNKSSLNRLSVPYGKTASLTLSDGTKICVNAGSKIVYPSVFTKDKREIFVSGEVYLDVVKDKEHPFVVRTNLIDINVLGTKLNVSAYDDNSFQSVVLVSGAVTVRSKELGGDYNIHPGQMLSYGKTSRDVNIQKVDVSNYTSWIHGYLILDNESLDDVLQKLARHYNLTFLYDREAMKNVRRSGKLNHSVGIEKVLNFISISVPVKYKIDGRHVTIDLKP